MHKKELLAWIISMTQELLKSEILSEYARLKKGSFTRNRKLSWDRLMMFILRGIKQSLQLSLDEFYEAIGRKEDTVSKQAASKARTNLNPEAVKVFFTETAKKMSSASDLELWKNYRLCAIDGSDLALDNSKELKSFYGCSGRNKDACTAMASLAYDPLNNVILDAGLYPYATDERTAAIAHIEAVGALELPENAMNLYIMDRGYPSRDFLSYLLDKGDGTSFIMRVRRKFNLEFDAITSDGIVEFVWNDKTYRVRIIKVTLNSGEVETLITNLSAEVLPAEEAGNLYFSRWCIETKYNSLKNKLELENMSGRRPVTVQQDFWATLYIANLTASIEWQSDEIIQENLVGKSNLYNQKTNENRALRKLRSSFVDCLLESNPVKRIHLFNAMIREVAKYPVAIKPDRSFSRSTPRIMKFSDRYKSIT